MQNTSENNEAEELCPKVGGVVRRLVPDWPALLDLLPALGSSVSIHRSPHVMWCRTGRFPEMMRIGSHGYRLAGEQGDALRMDLWEEAWWYDEIRDGRRRPCLEITDAFGRGFLKVCYRHSGDAEIDLPRVAAMTAHEGDAWDLLHVRQANLLDCGCAHGKLPSRNRSRFFIRHLTAIFSEAISRGLPLGVIVPNDPATTWDEIAPRDVMQAGCWTTVSAGDTALHLRASHFHTAELISSGARPVARFHAADGAAALILIGAEGPELESLEQLGRALRRSGYQFHNQS